MKTLYFELNMGAAGDMLLAALLELHPDKEDFLSRLNGLGIPHVAITAHPASKCGIAGTHVRVCIDGQEEESIDVDGEAPHEHAYNGHHHDQHPEHPHSHSDAHSHTHHHPNHHNSPHTHHEGHHHHHGLQEITAMIHALKLPDKVKSDAIAVYKLIAEAESAAHNAPVDQIHFHEVGSMDAVADIVGVCMLLEELAPAQILASPINVGFGQVRCAHGILPVPAPATAFILKDIPIDSGAIRGELCTPTGAALLKHFVSSFGALPVLKVSAVGYGMGKKDFPAANCVRVLLGQTADTDSEVVELSCNIDDMTAEAVAFATQLLMEKGALDVYTSAIGMKKSRPGTLLTCMCTRETTDEMVSLIFQHTTTLGLREHISRRYTLNRTEGIKDTSFGPVRYKEASGHGVEKTKLEYEDLARIARENDLSLNDVKNHIRQS